MSPNAAPAYVWPKAGPTEEARRPAEWRANTPLFATGIGLFSLGYAPNFVLAVPSAAGGIVRAFAFPALIGCAVSGTLSGGNSKGGGYVCHGQHGAVQLLIPVVGPILFADDHPRDTLLNPEGRPLSPVAAGLLYTSSALQAAGLLSLIASAVAGGASEPTKPARRGASSLSFFLAPLGGPGSLGVAFGVERW